MKAFSDGIVDKYAPKHDGVVYYSRIVGSACAVYVWKGKVKVVCGKSCKRDIYESYGICEWKNIIYIFESNNKINMPMIDAIIKHRIIPML